MRSALALLSFKLFLTLRHFPALPTLLNVCVENACFSVDRLKLSRSYHYPLDPSGNIYCMMCFSRSISMSLQQWACAGSLENHRAEIRSSG